jgi:LytS/YehU family sensor histidine kinase
MLPPMAALGFPILAAESIEHSGREGWIELGWVVLRLAVLCTLYVVALGPLRRSALWQSPRLNWRTGLAIAAAGVLLPVAEQVLLQTLGLWRMEPLQTWLPKLATGKVPIYVLFPALLVCGTALIELGLATDAEARRVALRSEQMLARYREARLKQLRLQLHPHFLFNALNSVSALLVKDRAAAAAMMERLQSLYARSLRSLERQLVPVAEEIDWCREYLAVERERFSDRLRVEVRVDPEAASAAVPPLLLQPLVENAVRHGVGREPGPAWIEIAAWVADDGTLRLRVANGGRGRGAMREGFGLRHTRRRLLEAYGREASLVMIRRSGVVEAALQLPQGGGRPAAAGAA